MLEVWDLEELLQILSKLRDAWAEVSDCYHR